MAIELTPDVSPESGGFGFQVPVFRMNQGVNAATANPLSRGAMGQPMDMVSESQFGLNPNVLAMADEAARQQFYTGVDELNQFVNRAAEFGIDPSKVDMASPESFALNQEFRKRVQALQQQARGITTGAAQQALLDREMDRASMLESRELVKEQRQENIDQKRKNNLSRKYLSGFKTQEDLLLRKAQQELTPDQAKAFRKNATNLYESYDKRISEINSSTLPQEDKVFLIEELNMRKEEISPLSTGKTALYIQEGQPGFVGTPSLAPGQSLALSSPVKMEGLMSPVVNDSGQIIQSTPTINQVVNLAYYTNDKGERIPVLSANDPNASRSEGTALVGVGFVSKPSLTEGKIKEAVEQKRYSLLTELRKRKPNMNSQELIEETKIVAKTLEKFESDLRNQGNKDEPAYVVLPDDRAKQLLMSKVPTFAPTKRQAQKMTEVEKLMKSKGLNKK